MLGASAERDCVEGVYIIGVGRFKNHAVVAVFPPESALHGWFNVECRLGDLGVHVPVKLNHNRGVGFQGCVSCVPHW